MARTQDSVSGSEIFYLWLKSNGHLFSLFFFFHDSSPLIFPLKFYPFVTFRRYQTCLCYRWVGRLWQSPCWPALPSPPLSSPPWQSPFPQPLLRFTSFILFNPCGRPARPLNPPFIVHSAHKGLACSLISLMCLWTAAVAL